MTRQQEREWKKRIDEAEDEVLQIAIEWEQNPSRLADATLRDVVQKYKEVRAGK